MGLNEEQAFEAVRLSLGLFSSEEEIQTFINQLKNVF
jgi:cysteine sulfinate desulfinase/cysteine desulfurase-like protein